MRLQLFRQNPLCKTNLLVRKELSIFHVDSPIQQKFSLSHDIKSPSHQFLTLFLTEEKRQQKLDVQQECRVYIVTEKNEQFTFYKVAGDLYFPPTEADGGDRLGLGRTA